MEAKELLEVGFAFHGHRCPAMPLGLRAGIAAMKTLGVERSKDKELHVISETGKGHAAGCFLDGIMVATGCAYGKSNIEKLYYNKIASTLVDVNGKRAVRVTLKPEFFSRMLHSPLIEQRKRGIPPQDIPPEIMEPLIERVLSLPEDAFLLMGPVVPFHLTREKGVFEAAPCMKCGELVFVNKLVEEDGKRICLGCKHKADKAE